jgi:hypothetical protein
VNGIVIGTDRSVAARLERRLGNFGSETDTPTLDRYTSTKT